MSEQQQANIADRIAGLPRELAPRNDPWPAIEQRLQHREQSTPASRPSQPWRWLGGAMAASITLAFVAGWLLGDRWGEEGKLPVAAPEIAASQNQNPTTARTLTTTLLTSEAEYQAAFREFIAVGDARDQLPLKTIENIELGWADMVAAENALVVALERDPENVFLVRRMFELRSRQLGFLQQLAALDRSNRRMTI